MRFCKICGGILLAFIVACFGVMPATAADIPEYRLQVSPVTLDLTLEPGTHLLILLRFKTPAARAIILNWA